MRFFTNKRRVAVAAAGGIAVLCGGLGAYAYWTQGGTGSGSATTGTTTDVTVNQNAFPAASALYLGMPTAVTLSGTFNNPNPGPVKVGTVTGALDEANLPTGCVAADFTVAGSAIVNAEIPSGNPVGTWSGVTIIMNNTPANQNGCKSKTIPILYTVTAAP